jgi:hypothetical protein
MLTLIDAGWESVRTAAASGRRAETLSRVTRLLALPDLPASLAAEAHRLAGELYTEAERYSEARRHLRAAAVLEPSHARTFYLWGLAFEDDPHGCDRRAALRFRRASELEPGNQLYRAAFGRAAVRAGRTKLGVRALLAAGRGGADLGALRIAVDGLIEAGYVKTARGLVNSARFLHPGDRGLAALVERTRFEAARREQERRRTTRHRQDAAFAKDGGRVVLPFVRVEGGTRDSAGPGLVRRDVVSLPKPHFPRLRAGKGEG